MTDTIVFFPFTHLTRVQVAAVRTFFDSFYYLDIQPEERPGRAQQVLMDTKKMIPRRIDSGIAANAEQMFVQYREWIRIHQGNEHNLKLLLKDTPYFKNDTHVSAIKSQLRGMERNGGGTGPVGSMDASEIEKQLLFLKAAHLCDVQNESIDTDLAAVDRSTAQLFSALQGGLDDALKVKKRQDNDRGDPGGIMTRERVYAWGACMSCVMAFSQEMPPVFVTTSEAVFNYLESNCKDSVNALDIDEIKVHENDCENKKEWQSGFFKTLRNAVLEGGFRKKEKEQLQGLEDACSCLASVKVNLLSGNEINKSFNLSDKQVAVCLVRLKR